MSSDRGNADFYMLCEGEPVDVAALRRGLFVVCNSKRLAEQVMREMRVAPYLIGPDDHLFEQRIIKAGAEARAELDANQRISVVIPNYNYGRFIEQAIDSVLAQTKPVDEIIVVDDASTDDSLERVARYGDKVRLIKHERNRGTAGATRNTGIAAATGAYIVCLDADDMLEPTYIETCFNAIRADAGIGVAYTGVQTHVEPKGERIVHHHWPIPFNWSWQTARKSPPNNCIPTASLFRRLMWERCGGYDESIRCGEDAAFWVKALGCGFEAVKCTEDPLFVYRRHGPSMSTTRPWDDLSVYNRAYTGFKPLAAPTNEAPVLHDYTRPVVSVIIPVGPGHARYLPAAIESVIAQTFDRWELIVVNDSGEQLPLKPYPFVRVVSTPAPRSGISAARNVGIDMSTAPLVFFLDADDWLLPTALGAMLRTYSKGKAGYIFTDWWAVDGEHAPREMQTREYDQRGWLDPNTRGLHPASVLMAREDALRIGKFDEGMRGFEEWEFFIRCAIVGLCGVRVPVPLLVYRTHTGNGRIQSQARRAEIVQSLMDRYGEYMKGGKELMACCGGNTQAVSAALESLVNVPHYEIAADGTVEMAYVGPRQGEVTYFGKYKGCIGCKTVKADPGDVKRLELTGVWRVVEKTLTPAPQPAVIA